VKFVSDLLTYLVITTTLLGGAYGVFIYRSLPKHAAIVSALMLYGGVNELSGLVMYHYLNNNVIIYNIYILAELCLLILASVQQMNKKVFTTVGIVCIILYSALWCYLFFIMPHSYFMVWMFLSSCILLSVFYFCPLLIISRNSDRPFSEPWLWVCLGHVIYFACDIPFFSMYKYFVAHAKTIGALLQNINDTLAVLRYLFVSYGFYLFAKQHKTTHGQHKH